MYHCCSFDADDVYYLVENDLYSNRRLSIGYCPICMKPIAELVQERFDGKIFKVSKSGIKANCLMLNHKDEILYSMRQCNRNKFKSRPFGWKYGVNKTVKLKGVERIKQYACDFYGNKEQVKLI